MVVKIKNAEDFNKLKMELEKLNKEIIQLQVLQSERPDIEVKYLSRLIKTRDKISLKLFLATKPV